MAETLIAHWFFEVVDDAQDEALTRWEVWDEEARLVESGETRGEVWRAVRDAYDKLSILFPLVESELLLDLREESE